jgi:hypothetical protein
MNHWHISKSVSIGHLATTFVIIISVVTYITNVEHAIDVNLIKIKNNKELITSNNKNIFATINRIDKRLETITNILLKQNK